MKTHWPELDYQEWKDTYHTLHRYLQIVGKLRIYKAPWINHSWHATFYVHSRGLTTSAIPLGDRNLTIYFDFVNHQVVFEDSFGETYHFNLQDESVAQFFEKFLHAMKVMNISGYENDFPVECEDHIPFSKDEIHKTYDPIHAHHFFQVLVRVTNVFQKYRAEFSGKSSPVHFFWGSFDLAVTRFSGEVAPEHPGIAPHISPLVMKEAYSHEVISCGFWPGNEQYPHTVFYSYAYPVPEGFAQSTLEPKEAFFHKELGEFLLHYDVVQKSQHPEEMLLDFLHSSFNTASQLAQWDSNFLKETPFRYELNEKYQSSSLSQ